MKIYHNKERGKSMKVFKKFVSILTACILLAVGCPWAPTVSAVGGNTFTQGLWRGQDPRASFDSKTGYYYYVEDTSEGMVLFRSKSLVDRGDVEERRNLPTGYPLCAPVYVEKMNGVTYNKWFAFGTSAWECDGDPFTGNWSPLGSFGLNGWTLDHYAFMVEEGELAGEWYLLWAAGEDISNTTSFSAENIHISRMLTPSKLENPKQVASDAILHCAKGSGWSGWDVEAPSVVQKNGTVTMIYSGTDCKTVQYALGLCVFLGGDITKKENWRDLNSGFMPAFSNTIYGEYGTPYGTGVAAPIPSADGTEMWFYYNAKLYYTVGGSVNKNKEAWTRIINLKKIEWEETQINGKTYTIPDLGTPDKMGTTVTMPSGDPGHPDRGYYFFEAEHSVPFGRIDNATVQNQSGDDGEPYNLMFEAMRGRKLSLTGCMKHFDWFAEGDGTSGLHFRNVPASKSLVIRAGTNDPNGGFDILVNGVQKASVTFKQNLKPDGSVDSSYIFNDYRVTVDIPDGATVTLQYTKGKYDDSAVDFVVFENTEQYSTDGTTIEPTQGTNNGTTNNNSNASNPTNGNNPTNGTDSTNGNGETISTSPDGEPLDPETTLPDGSASSSDQQANAPSSPDGVSSSSTWWIWLIIIVVVLAAGGGGFAFWFFKLRKKV